MNRVTYQRWRSFILPEPLPLNEQEERAIAQRNAAAPSGQSQREFSGATPFDATLLQCLVCTCGYHFQHIQSILRHVNAFATTTRVASVAFDRVMPEAFSLSRALLRDDQYREILGSTFGRHDPDCKEIRWMMDWPRSRQFLACRA